MVNGVGLGRPAALVSCADRRRVTPSWASLKMNGNSKSPPACPLLALVMRSDFSFYFWKFIECLVKL